MKAYCNCRELTKDRHGIKYQETETTNEDTCSYCGYYPVWAKDDENLKILLGMKEEK